MGYKGIYHDINNDFTSAGFNYTNITWVDDVNLYNYFRDIELINAIYFNYIGKFLHFEIQSGIRAEHTINLKNETKSFILSNRFT